MFATNNNYIVGILVTGFDLVTTNLTALADYPPFTFTLSDAFFGVFQDYLPSANQWFPHGGMAFTGALPPGSVVSVSNVTFFSGLGTSHGHYNNRWQNVWPGVSQQIDTNHQVCSICFLNFALLGGGGLARIILTNNSYLNWMGQPQVQYDNVFGSEFLISDGAVVTVSNSTFRCVSNAGAGALPVIQVYAQTQFVAGQVNFSSVKFITGVGSSNSGGSKVSKEGEAPLLSAAAAINVANNAILVGTSNWYYGNSNSMTSPVTIQINYTMQDGSPTAPPAGFELTGGNVTVSGNFITGAYTYNTAPNNAIYNNYSCNAVSNFTITQHEDTAYSLPIILRVAFNKVFGQPQFPFQYRIITSKHTTGTIIDLRGNYFQPANAWTSALQNAPYTLFYNSKISRPSRSTPANFRSLHVVRSGMGPMQGQREYADDRQPLHVRRVPRHDRPQ